MRHGLFHETVRESWIDKLWRKNEGRSTSELEKRSTTLEKMGRWKDISEEGRKAFAMDVKNDLERQWLPFFLPDACNCLEKTLLTEEKCSQGCWPCPVALTLTTVRASPEGARAPGRQGCSRLHGRARAPPAQVKVCGASGGPGEGLTLFGWSEWAARVKTTEGDRLALLVWPSVGTRAIGWPPATSTFSTAKWGNNSTYLTARWWQELRHCVQQL